ncbi:MAG: hypothetical protein V4563_14145 [Pseudomonadota bacterium]
MIVVLPFCGKDASLLKSNLEWMVRLGKQDCTCLLSFERGSLTPEIEQLASQAFSAVEKLEYDPYEGDTAWPKPQNYSWQTVAWHEYSNGKRPWLWLEPDAVPLAKDWTKQISKAYYEGGKPFAGCVVRSPQTYCSGIAVYPGDVLEYCQTVMRCRNAPFDMAMASETLAHTQDICHLIDHRRAVGFTFEHPDDLKIIRPGAVIFHKCDDGSLTKRLMGIPHDNKVMGVPVETSTFYHSGNLGDIIYALYAIKKHGGGDLIIGPDQRDTIPCSNPISPQQFDLLLPLLQAQPYIRSVLFRDRRPEGALNLNCFRNYWLNPSIRRRSGADSLCKMHFHLLSILDRYKDDEPWLTVPDPIKSDRIIVARSLRHRNWDFDWQGVIDKFGSRLLFVGLPKEYEIFAMCHLPRIEFKPVSGLMEMAQIIAGAKGCVMNQSFPCSLAIGLGKTLLQEVFPNAPDCQFRRKNFSTSLDKFKP